MNKTKIEWCDYTWNPVTGCDGPDGCGKPCDFCYANKITKRFNAGIFTPYLHVDRLVQPEREKRPGIVFVCSMGDLFGPSVLPEWIRQVFAATQRAPWHTYVFLTKNPKGLSKVPHPLNENKWFGVSITSDADLHRITTLKEEIPKWNNKFVSFEPLLGQLPEKELADLLSGIQQVIIGAQTNPDIKPEIDWIRSITWAAYKAGRIPVFFKNSIPHGARVRRELMWPLNKSKNFTE